MKGNMQKFNSTMEVEKMNFDDDEDENQVENIN